MLAAEPVLAVSGLNLYSPSGGSLVRGVSLSLRAGETLALVGASGSGKTMTLKSVMNLLPDGIREEVLLKRVTPRRAMVFQDPVRSLDPLFPVFRQLCEVIRFRQGLDRRQARSAASALVRKLDLPRSLETDDRLPSALSGGQCQRIMIAMALCCEPELLLCDEPTTALDVTVQDETLSLISSLQRQEGFAMVFVTHNLAVAARMCRAIAVMDQGQIVEYGGTDEVIRHPRHDRTRALLSAVLN